MNIIYSLILLFLITSFEIGSFNVFFGTEAHNAVIIFSFSCVLLLFFYRVAGSGKISNSGYFTTNEFRYFFIIIFFSACYFLLHSFLIGPAGSAKYSAYVLMLFILTTQMVKKDFDRLCILFFSFMAIVSFASVVQILLVGISGKSLYDFELLTQNGDPWFRDIGYAMPYYLTYSSVSDSDITLGPLTFVRAIGFSSEPKMFSILLWVAYGICLSWRTRNSGTLLFLIRAMLLVGLFFAHAYSSLLVVFFAAFFYLILKKPVISPKLKVLLILVVPFLVALAVTFLETIILGVFSSGGYAAGRVDSFLYSSSGFFFFDAIHFGLFGSNIADGENVVAGGVTMLLHWSRLGHLGFLLYLMTISFIIYKSIINFGYLKKHEMYSQALLISVFITFYQLFMSQPYTLFSIFILASIYMRSRPFSYWESGDIR
tara:strand:+ start:3365 stop:4651 length:1287 start_codon:yes stop_codon:yes gene_type:complete